MDLCNSYCTYLVVDSLVGCKGDLVIMKLNFAYKMYLKVGFEIVDENEEEYIMICYL